MSKHKGRPFRPAVRFHNQLETRFGPNESSSGPEKTPTVRPTTARGPSAKCNTEKMYNFLQLYHNDGNVVSLKYAHTTIHTSALIARMYFVNNDVSLVNQGSGLTSKDYASGKTNEAKKKTS